LVEVLEAGVVLKENATYLFALVRRARAPSISSGPAGLPGAGSPRTIAVDPGLWLIAADAPRAIYGETAIERGLKDMPWVSACALAHERVVEHFGRGGALLPMKLFTLFATDERAVRHVRARRARLGRLLDQVEGRQEWGVRLSGDGRLPAGPRGRVGGRRSGTEFLLAKKAERDRDGQRAERASRDADALFRALARHADDSRRRPVPAGAGVALWLDAAFLVPRGGRRSFEAALRREAKALLGRGYRVTLTGPWPPYNFAETGP
jgi:Gas vesicle synthesis protein GvpL/GvpF